MNNVMTTDKEREAFFAARSTMQTIGTLWELSFFADRPFDGDVEDLSIRAKEFASDQGWELDGNRDRLSELVNEYVGELPLSVLVRSDWHTPEPGIVRPPSEFEILLSTGGPAVRITGDLDSYVQAYRPQLQYQDWGTPWIDFPESNVEALLWFSSVFYYGEG
jgi:hypothetical protein